MSFKNPFLRFIAIDLIVSLLRCIVYGKEASMRVLFLL